MAPTAILAEQHFATLSRLFEAAGPQLEAALVGRPTAVSLLTGSIKGKERDAASTRTRPAGQPTCWSAPRR